MKNLNLIKTSLFIAAATILITGCGDDNPGGVPGSSLDFIISDNATLNPSGVAPLTALIQIETEEPVRVRLRVLGKNGSASDVIHEFEQVDTTLEIPVLGLYANFENEVELTFFDDTGSDLGTKSYTIQTTALLADLPEIEIDVANENRMAEGFTFANYFGHREGGNPTPQRAFIFDRFGDIRWYLNYAGDSDLNNLFYDNGMERLANGNLFFGDRSSQKIYEIDMFGEILNSWEMPGYGFHHDVIEKPDGDFIATVNKFGESTVEDYIIEIDRNNGAIINEWDLNLSLDNTRRAWETNLADLNVDWFHANAVSYDPADNTIIVSGRTQGTVKLTENNEVVWILAPHKEWDTAGNGEDLNQFLLQPLDSDSQPITDESVKSGDVNHPDFEWSWYQHATNILPDGNLMLFDNGENRNFSGTGTYSRAVEYEIDEENMTIRQVWQYGKERGPETYSRIVSDVDFFPVENHVFFTPGAVSFNGDYGKVIEIDYDSGDVLFEATIRPPVPAFGLITLHRSERMSLYPE
ncbi:MAG TPA: aryl-sulfate sulfotransferase [Balneolaceae bacterium]|nr:aryl-sulfate sulfotransferase [Balneolaceae bacterium]